MMMAPGDGALEPPHNQDEFEQLIGLIGQGIVAQDEHGQIIQANDAAERVLGLTLAQMQGRTSLDSRWRVVYEDGSPFPGDQHPAMQSRTKGQIVRGTIMGVYNPVDDNYRWLRVDSFPRTQSIMRPSDAANTPVPETTLPVPTWTVFADITSEWKAWEAQREAAAALEARIRETTTILESITDAFITVDRMWCFTYLNPEGERLLQVSREVLSRKSLWEALPETIGTVFDEMLHQAMNEAVPVSFETFYAPLEIWLEVRAYPSPVGLSLYMRDVTERRATINRLAFDAGALAQVQDVIVAVDNNERVTYWSESAAILLGASVAEAQGQPWENFFTVEWYAPGDREQAIDTLQTNGKWQGEYYCVLPDGRRIPVESATSRLTDRQSGAVTGVLSVMRDISERIAAQKAIQLSEEKQRRFLREMLFSMSEGRLILCDTIDDLPTPLPLLGEPVLLTAATLRVIRRMTTQAAQEINMEQERIYDLETAVGEAAMNAVTHAGGGIARVGFAPERKTVQVWVRDEGKGIDTNSIHRATLERGFTTRGTMGHGFWLMLHTCDRIFLLTSSTGTTVVLEQDGTASAPFWMQQGMMAEMSDIAVEIPQFMETAA